MCSGNDYDSDGAINQIAETKIKFCANSCVVSIWHQKCMEEESTLVALNQKLNKYKLAKYKCQSILILKEEEVIRARLIKL